LCQQVVRQSAVRLISAPRALIAGASSRTIEQHLGVVVMRIVFVEERFGLEQVGGIEAFGEPGVDGGERGACFGAAILPMRASARGNRGAQLP